MASEQDKLHRAERARELLEDPILKESFDRIERAASEAMLAPTADDETRRRMADRVNAIRFVRGEFISVINANRDAPAPIKVP